MDSKPQDEPDERTAVEALAARFRGPLLRWFTRRGQSPDAAEDCVQETFVRLSQANYSAIKVPESYLFTIASSVAVDRSRRARSRAEYEHDPIDGLDLVSEAPSPARVLEGRDAILR